MFKNFKYESVALKDIILDDRNPRIVTQKKLTSQAKILEYLFEHEDLASFVNKIASEGKNHGAERPYIIKSGANYTVIEGNTRIAAYKLLTGHMSAPKDYVTSIPSVSQDIKDSMLMVDCSIAPSRDALMPLMASAHFGTGDKSKWGYLGSRKAIYNEWQSGKSIAKLAKTFDLTPGKIKDYLIEYDLYLNALSLKWTKKEEARLLDPAVEFNPPVRFLQGKDHKKLTGISYDKVDLKVLFEDADARKKFQHLISKLVVEDVCKATDPYDVVFKDYNAGTKTKGGTSTSGKPATSGTGTGGGTTPSGGAGNKLKPGALFNYPSKMHNNVVDQLMKEAKNISCKNFPAAGTFLLRNIIEAILKHIIDEQKANPAGKSLTLATGLDICQSNQVTLHADDKKVLKEFKKNYLEYLNLGAHGTVVPNETMLLSARDCIDQFVKRNV